MKKIVFFILVVTMAAIGIAQEKKAENNIKWNSFDSGITQAKKSGKKVLVDVYTDWCTWCKKMDANTYTDATIRKYLQDHFVLIKLNAESTDKISYGGKKLSGADFSQAMGVTGFPSTLFLDSKGSPITMLPGYAEPNMFIHVLSFISEDQYKHKKFSDYLAEKGVK